MQKRTPWNKGLTKEDPRVWKYTFGKIGKKASDDLRRKLSEVHKGKWLSEHTKKKLSEIHKKLYAENKYLQDRLYKFEKGDKNHNWKGDAVGYVGLHAWVRRILGRPGFCSLCKTAEKKKFAWANISRQYNRNENDWMSLCYSCHKKYDLQQIKEIEKYERTNS